MQRLPLNRGRLFQQLLYWLKIHAGVVAMLALCLGAPSAALSEPRHIAIVVSSGSAPYLDIARGITTALDRNDGVIVQTIGVEGLDQISSVTTTAIVAIGLRALQAAAASEMTVPVLSTLIPRTSFEKIAQTRVRERGAFRFSAVFVDQPISRQLDLIRLALPDRKRVGVVLGPDSASLQESLSAEARARGLQLNVVSIAAETELFPALERVLAEADVLLSVPDGVVSTAHTIPGILHTAYRHRVPVIGFSPAYVRAGALIAVYSEPAQLAQQAAELLRRRTLPAPQYPVGFDVVANYHVARSLEIALEPEHVLAEKLRALGAKQ